MGDISGLISHADWRLKHSVLDHALEWKPGVFPFEFILKEFKTIILVTRRGGSNSLTCSFST